MSGLREFLRRSGTGRVGFALALALVIFAIAAPWIAPANPAVQDLPARLAGPSAGHPMGTDELGRDILSRILYGARVSLLVGICVVVGAGLVGLAIGAFAGYCGGWFDNLVNIVLINAFLSFPGILLAIAFAAFLGPGIGKVIVALIVTGWAGYARLARKFCKPRKWNMFSRRVRSVLRPRAFCCGICCPISFSPCWFRRPSAWPARSSRSPR